MKSIKHIIYVIIGVCCCFISNAQTIDLKGKVFASSDIESIHVLNVTAHEFTITNGKGEFEILASVNDTILISSVQYIPRKIVVTQAVFKAKLMHVNLIDRVNELDEVVVGKVLTGNLLSDIENSEAKRDINFYDVGIPGYTGVPKTQKERRLYEADAGKSIVIAPLYVGINLHKILNKISGRTKKLKHAVKLEAQVNCMNKMKSEFSNLLFANDEIQEHLINDFFYYIAEDPKFTQYCENYNSFEIYEFLLQKLYLYSDEKDQEKD